MTLQQELEENQTESQPLDHTQRVRIGVRLEEGTSTPDYSSLWASGADVRAHLSETIDLAPGKRALIPTGLSFCLPQGFEIQVRPRSGLAAKHGITVLNTPGTIDADYRGEVKVILINLGDETFQITPGMRIAQLVLAPVIQAQFEQTESLSETVRGEGGFGHTGFH